MQPWEVDADSGRVTLQPELASWLARFGLQQKDLTPLASGHACEERRRLRRVATALLDAACEPTTEAEWEIDLLLDTVVEIDEARVLPGLARAPLAALRR